MEFDCVIVRLGGEIGIKSAWTRRSYEKLLIRNIRKVLKHQKVDYTKFKQKRGRIYIKTYSAQSTAVSLTRVFGVSSVSPAREISSDMNEIVGRTVELADMILESGSSFAVRCHRVGRHQYSSMDVCREAGEQVLKNLGNRNLRVELKNPQVTIGIDVRDENAYVFKETMYGVDGFPLGSQAKVICLLSGGIDSAVACWLAMKRGCPIIPVYFDNTPYADKGAIIRTLDVAKKLFEWSIGFPRKIYIVPHGRNLESFIKESPGKLRCILCKRMMYRIASRIAEIEKAEGIITGEAIGEQASQTIHNLRILNEATNEYPVHRPILGFNKLETEKLAKKIGTFEISTQKTEGCSAPPKKPATKARLELVKKAEQKLDIENMIEKSIKTAETTIV